MKKNHVYLLLGSNLGEREELLQKAQGEIAVQVGKIVQESSIYETDPWGNLEQPTFLNQVVVVETTLHPIDVLATILKVEKSLGRERIKNWGERLIDIDILYYADVIIQMQDLVIPHLYLHERRFTLAPLAEIAPDYIHPKLKQSNKELLENCLDDGKVLIFTRDINPPIE